MHPSNHYTFYYLICHILNSVHFKSRKNETWPCCALTGSILEEIMTVTWTDLGKALNWFLKCNVMQIYASWQKKKKSQQEFSFWFLNVIIFLCQRVKGQVGLFIQHLCHARILTLICFSWEKNNFQMSCLCLFISPPTTMHSMRNHHQNYSCNSLTTVFS